ncbi:hypothetical protein [Aestuariivirga sp.]|jgi:hypothetical protein|uniref:hypothetical protein n=1 Tax=Aestuariivirga sp. TaxID=2650926 RepID=UPI0037849A88
MSIMPMSAIKKLLFIALISTAAFVGFHDLSVHAQTPRLRERLVQAFPAIELTMKESTGRAAIDRLGTRLPAVADWYGKTAQQLRNELLSDRRMRVDGKGRIFFVEEIDGQLAASTPPATQQGVLDGELAPLDQSFLLHSKLGSQKTIYLNFVGATLTKKAWNWILNRAEIIAPPFDLVDWPGQKSPIEGSQRLVDVRI